MMWRALHMILLFTVANSDTSSITVYTTSGEVHGKVVHQVGHSTEAFLGIPYGQAPVGELRFAPPQPYHKEGVIEATAHGKSCPQFIIGFNDDGPFTKIPGKGQDERIAVRPIEEFSEDCLNLNVWTPHPRPEKAAVLVFIHGGLALSTGSADESIYDGASLAHSQSIIVVSIKYRLGELGFLSFGTPDAPGNQGLMDQTLALKWVNDNIEHFGGDHTRITVFGESSGSASIGYHMSIPSGRHLFQQAILLDGTAITRFGAMEQKEATEIANSFSEVAGCFEGHDDEKLRCLRAKSVSELINATFKGVHAKEKMFMPVVDGEFLPDLPDILMKSGQICPHIKFLVGTTYHRGFSANRFHINQKPTEDHVVTMNDLKNLIKRIFKDDNEHLRNAIEFHYTDWKNPESPEAIRHKVIDLPNDAYVVCPANQLSDELAKSGNDVYRYHIYFTKEASSYPKWAGLIENEQFDLIFGHTTPSKLYTEREQEFSKEVMGYIGRFVKTGNPNTEGKKDWPRYSLRRKGYFLLNPKSTGGGVAKAHQRAKQCGFWLETYPVAKQAYGLMETKKCS